MIYTSYFAKLKSIPSNIVPVSICAKAPDWYNGIQYKKLAPKYDFFMEWKKNQDNDYYIKHFQEEVLDQLRTKDVIDELFHLSQNKSVVLLCYEKPTDFCHRHLVANWFKMSRIECNEYNFE